ncbi:hypothetical protein K505DRAFT_89226 [Melanomma pulvis-pyrius CBS 109.77]|uniref:Uncharacterized protein n=1 Tax=Melanomma pulvis-pyrius CBS 109.77 TaxID=1314802 RepID=A0A6A6X1L1_9PLEO|nr:hypothetical protein K505DRAFT_89226 [Melanomma pulvis-pyrius CBS 109.77]
MNHRACVAAGTIQRALGIGACRPSVRPSIRSSALWRDSGGAVIAGSLIMRRSGVSLPCNDGGGIRDPSRGQCARYAMEVLAIGGV